MRHLVPKGDERSTALCDNEGETMQVTETQLAALRALCAGDDEAHLRELDKVEAAGEVEPYGHLIGGAFAEAVYLRFVDGTRADAIRYVASVRMRSGFPVDELDPRVAEQLIGAVVGWIDPPVLDEGAKADTELSLLPYLFADSGWSAEQAERLFRAAQGNAERYWAGLADGSIS